MSIEDVMVNREREAPIILKNLEDYGNIEPPGFIGRALSAGGQQPFQFTAANYFHVAAYLRDNPRYDTRYYSEAELKANNIEIPANAPKLIIEQWGMDVQGEDVTASLMNYYNVQDIPSIEMMPHGLIPDLPQYRHYAVAELQQAGYPISADADNNMIFQGYEQIALGEGLQPAPARLVAQIALKINNLTKDYARDHLFSPEEIEEYRANPQQLYKDSILANKVFKSIRSGVLHPFKKQEEHPIAGNSADLFKGLRVTLYPSSGELMDLTGHSYNERLEVVPEKKLTLYGSAAYDFLAVLNAADKDAAGTEKRKTVTIDFQYNELTFSDTIQLGAGSFDNATNIQTALENFFAPHCNDEQWDQVQRTFAVLGAEEEIYMISHPEIEELNKKSAAVLDVKEQEERYDPSAKKNEAFYQAAHKHYYQEACNQCSMPSNPAIWGVVYAEKMAADGLDRRTMNAICRRIDNISIREVIHDGIKNLSKVKSMKVR